MSKLYEFLAGPALWASFVVFTGGLIVRLTYLYVLSRESERLLHNHAELKLAFRSFIRRLIPLESVDLRTQPVFGIAFLLFHICLLVVPLFLLAHNTLWEEAFSISLPSLPDSFADLLTVVFFMSASVLLARRIICAEVGSLSTARDYSSLFLISAPFVTGFLAYHQIGSYKVILNLHILFAEMLFVIIPFKVRLFDKKEL